MTRTRSWSASFTNLLSSKNAPEKAHTGRLRRDTFTSISEAHAAGPSRDSPQPPPSRSSRPGSRPMSIVQPYQPPPAEVAGDTLPELQPIFTFLNSHSKKLYTEGYFLKLNDLNHDGKPSADRTWVECFAQLVGTVLSLWNAADLDAAGSDGEVVPIFLNLTDASIKMIDTLPTRSPDVPPLTNVLSISTAGRNRYLFHFNSHHSLTQWTAGIRLCMFEHSTLQEAYTGALIAGKGKTLNNINNIMEKTRFKYEDWARVRFGAGTPWRRCWAVISPPDEKSAKKHRAALKKVQKSAYQSIPILKGDIKFYNDKKSKKSQPIATITEAYSAYAIYPQSKPLIDQSTLVKIEAKIIIHSDPPSTSEGFVFVMPEAHPAVSGFEIMLRWLFPAFDTFHLYGRPGRLIADVNDVRSLMFAMPRERQYGYLDVVDLVNIIVAEGGALNSEAEWRRKLKELTAERMKASGGRGKIRSSLPAAQRFPNISFNDDGSSRSSSSLPISPSQLPPQHVPLNTPPLSATFHQRSASESTGYMNYHKHGGGVRNISLDTTPETSQVAFGAAPPTGRSDSSSDESLFQGPIDPAARRLQQQANPPSPDFVPMTPAMTHPPSSKPQHPLTNGRQIQTKISHSTLDVMGVGLAGSAAGAAYMEDHQRRGMPQYSSQSDLYESNMFEGVVPPRNGHNGGAITAPPPAFSASLVPPRPSTNPPEHSNMHLRYTPPPPPPGPPPSDPNFPRLPLSQQSQITAQSSLPYQSPIEPPPGFALQSSQVLLAGPPPTNDEKMAYREGYANRPPPTPAHINNTHLTAPKEEDDDMYRRFSWQDSEASTLIHLSNNDPRRQMRIETGDRNCLDPLPSPPIPAKVPFKSHKTPEVPPLQTSNISRKPLPSDDVPDSADSIGSLARHLISQDALDRIGTTRNESFTASFSQPADEDTLDRKRITRMQQMLNDSGSEYEEDNEEDEPDYASIDTSHERPPKRDADQPRAGVMKVVGNRPDPEVVIGDAHFRPSTAGHQKQPSDIPAVDFGMTVNQGRNLSTESKDVSRGNGLVVESHHRPISHHATPIGGDPRRQSYVPGVDLWSAQNQSSSKSSPANDEKKRESWSRPSPEIGHERKESQSSDSDQSKQRSMAWSPGMAQARGRSPGRDNNTTAEQYVSEKAAAAAAQQQSRSRYVHKRRSSGQLLSPVPASTPQRNVSTEHLPPPARPVSRGGNAAFIPNGLVSASGDYSNHLSAREQEYVAKQTGSTLLHIDHSKQKPPHQAGLLAAIETRELEKKHMMDSWKQGLVNSASSSPMVQQAIAQRQQLQQQQHQVQRKTTPSPRQIGTPSPSYGQYDQGSYFPQQQQIQPPQQTQQAYYNATLLQQQQQAAAYAYGQQVPQGQQQYYHQQQPGYGSQYYGGPGQQQHPGGTGYGRS